MTPEGVAHIIGGMFLAAFWVCAPLLAIGLAAGVLVSLVQIVTSIQDAGFSAIPRLVAFLGGALLLMPWMVHRAISYASDILGNLDRYAR